MLSSFGSSRVLVAIVFFWTMSSSALATTIDFLPGDGTLGNFGYPSGETMPSETFGQTFIAPSIAPSTNDVLTNFQFRVSLPAATTFVAYVYRWSSSMDTVMGPALFTSDPRNTSSESAEVVMFNPDIELDAGASYVLFASTCETPDCSKLLDGSGFGRFAVVFGPPGPGTYDDGNFVRLDSGAFTSTWDTNPADSGIGAGGDLAFSATFKSETQPVPEPGSLALVGGVALAAALAGRRRRK